MQEAALWILMFLVFPVWVATGFAEWCSHRATHIERTSGIRENLLHWLMYAEVGVGCLAFAFLEINAAVLAIVFGVFLVHEATVYVDLDYSTMRRDVGPFEQMVHSFMELLPLLALALLALSAWPQALAIFGQGDMPADWSLRPKAQPWPADYLLTAAAATAIFNALPLAQETWACLAAPPLRSRTRASPAPR
jgi:hypothetical protein